MELRRDFLRLGRYGKKESWSDREIEKWRKWGEIVKESVLEKGRRVRDRRLKSGRKGGSKGNVGVFTYVLDRCT